MTLNERTQAKHDAEDMRRAESVYRVQHMACESAGRLLRLRKHYNMLKAGLMSAREFIHMYGA